MLGGSGDISVAYESFQKRNGPINDFFDSLGENPNLIRVQPSEVFCNSIINNRCVGAVNGKAYYYDNNHLSNYGSSLLVEKIIEHFE